MLPIMATHPGRTVRLPRPRLADPLFTTAVGLLVVGLTLKDMWPLDPTDGAGTLFVAATCATLYLRRDHPVAVALVTLGACALYYPLIWVDGPLFVTFALALYNVAACGHTWIAATLGTVSAAATVATEMAGDENHLADAALFLLCGWIVAVVAVGGMLHNRNAFLAEARRRAEEAERNLEEEARRRAVEERLHMARELHDVLGHHLSLINVQSGAALHGFARSPERAEQALDAIRDASREALRELRATLGVLRRVDEDAPTAPAPSLTRITDLIDHTRRTGVDVSLETPGGIPPLPSSVDLAAYRIVQEALTNVTRHSGADRALVLITCDERRVRIRVDDDGRGGDVRPGSGTGVQGMGERARALGGGFEAGARPEGGFRVSATLPLHEEATA